MAAYSIRGRSSSRKRGGVDMGWDFGKGVCRELTVCLPQICVLLFTFFVDEGFFSFLVYEGGFSIC